MSTNASPSLAGLRKPSRQLASSLDNPHAFLPLLTRPRAAIDLGPKLLQAPHYLQKITGNIPRKSDGDKNARSFIQISRHPEPKSQLGISGNDLSNPKLYNPQQDDAGHMGGPHRRGQVEVTDQFQQGLIQIRRNPSKSAGTLGMGAKRFADSHPYAQTSGPNKNKPYRSPFAAGAENELRNSVQPQIMESRHPPTRTNPGFIKSFTQNPSGRNTMKPAAVSGVQVSSQGSQLDVAGRQGAGRALNPLDKQIQELQRDLKDLDGQYEFYANRVPRRTTDY